ncbi:MAG: amylo-alpha-1,6-glucosidase [Phocaeicola sp.]|nr:amylo-alpha-1,6-glucosidase [Phocaeicola sp.]MDD7448547.1 amylo-alpha-1,6-glucosidase [Prevotellaceae bacterium]
MSYLRFDKTLMGNIEESLSREILRTNRSGAYHCSTIVDCNTRKYHGLLVVPIPHLDDENHVLLSSLDESVIQHGASFNLGLHKYDGDNYSPKGHKYIREFDCEGVPTTIYRVGGVLLRKEKLFVHHEDRILIRYTLVEAHSQTRLQLRPFLAFRSVREYTHENTQANQTYETVSNGIKTCMYDGYPHLFMQLSKANTFHFHPDWYKGLEYTKEQERGYHFNEDLYVPGYFEVQLHKGESIIFSGGTSEIDTKDLGEIFQREAESRTPRSGFKQCLINAAHQFLNKQGEERYILAGYPWFKCRGRDLFISLPGLTLSIDEQEKFHTVMETATKAIYALLHNETSPLRIYETTDPDVLLWAVWCIQQYAKMQSMEEAQERYGKLVQEILMYYIENKHIEAKLHLNGLLHINGKDKALTWMNAMVYGKPVTPRSGYVVEINALWYNALRFGAELLAEETNFCDHLRTVAEKCKQTFKSLFLNEHGYLLDYVDGDNIDWSVRPNMIFAVAFDHSPLEKKEQKNILDIITRELLTPKGIRSLSPKSLGYNPNYVGTQQARDYAYHQGTAWPWLLGFYFEAYLKLHKMSGTSFVERYLIGIEDEMNEHCIGTIAELYDGNPPFKGRGAVSFAMNVAEILRTLYLLNSYDNP